MKENICVRRMLKGAIPLAKKARKPRADMKVGTFEKKNNLPPGTIRNSDGRDTRSDKRIGTIRKEAKRKTKK